LRGESVVAVEADGCGGVRIVRLRSEPPIALRQTGPSEVTMVSCAAAPLGGDDLRLRVDVAAGARLRIRSAAAVVAWPDRSGTPSRFRLAVRLGEGSRFDWRPEATIVAHRARHEIVVDLRMPAEAAATLREIVVLGRVGEPPGTARSRLDVEIDQRPLLRQETLIGAGGFPGWAGPASLSGARVLGSRLAAGAAAPAAGGEVPQSTPRRSSNRLAGPGLLVTAWGADTLAVAELLETH
jgi:urease accessory protein